MTRNRVNCFIAIRFGQLDTDAVYEKIEAIVTELGLQPRKINKIEHIENINQKIISELDESDITIADLTYARPSVYFEAGYSHRKTPVIYTCRSDHLNNKEDALKVHFDVDRYKIVFWEHPNDESFPSNLRSRLQYVIENLTNIPLVEDLKSYLISLNKTRLNPENIFHRIKRLLSQLNMYPRVERNHLNHEINIKGRLILCKEIFEMIETDFPIEHLHAQQPRWVEFSMILEEELNCLENLFDQSNYGRKVLYASYLNDFYKIYLETMTKLLQRSSIEYEEKYNRVKSGVEKLIKVIEKPVW
jgi:nucleoside 2-deoxyribosyltransferase